MADTTSVTKTILSVCATIGSKLQDLNIKNGNLRKWTRKMNRAKTQMIDDLEDMM